MLLDFDSWRNAYVVSRRCLVRGFRMSSRLGVSAAALTLLLLVIVVPASDFLPTATLVAGNGHGPPASDIQSLPPYTNQQTVLINYTARAHGGGSHEDDEDDAVS